MSVAVQPRLASAAATMLSAWPARRGMGFAMPEISRKPLTDSAAIPSAQSRRSRFKAIEFARRYCGPQSAASGGMETPGLIMPRRNGFGDLALYLHSQLIGGYQVLPESPRLSATASAGERRRGRARSEAGRKPCLHRPQAGCRQNHPHGCPRRWRTPQIARELSCPSRITAPRPPDARLCGVRPAQSVRSRQPSQPKPAPSRRAWISWVERDHLFWDGVVMVSSTNCATYRVRPRLVDLRSGVNGTISAAFDINVIRLPFWA